MSGRWELLDRRAEGFGRWGGSASHGRRGLNLEDRLQVRIVSMLVPELQWMWNTVGEIRQSGGRAQTSERGEDWEEGRLVFVAVGKTAPCTMRHARSSGEAGSSICSTRKSIPPFTKRLASERQAAPVHDGHPASFRFRKTCVSGLGVDRMRCMYWCSMRSTHAWTTVYGIRFSPSHFRAP